MIKALIIEDESLISRQLQSKINAVADDVQILEILPSPRWAGVFINFTTTAKLKNGGAGFSRVLWTDPKGSLTRETCRFLL